VLSQIELVHKCHAADGAGLRVISVDVLVELLKVGDLLAALLAHGIILLHHRGRRGGDEVGRPALLGWPSPLFLYSCSRLRGYLLLGYAIEIENGRQSSLGRLKIVQDWSATGAG
jgi:hypothetical protein